MSRRQVHRVRGRWGDKLGVYDWGAGEVCLGSCADGRQFSTLTIKGVRRLIAILQRIEADYREPL